MINGLINKKIFSVSIERLRNIRWNDTNAISKTPISLLVCNTFKLHRSYSTDKRTCHFRFYISSIYLHVMSSYSWLPWLQFKGRGGIFFLYRLELLLELWECVQMKVTSKASTTLMHICRLDYSNLLMFELSKAK